MIAFPPSPAIGQTYSYGSRTWVWTGEAWRRQINAGQTVSVFIEVGPLVELGVASIPYTVGTSWASVNYV